MSRDRFNHRRNSQQRFSKAGRFKAKIMDISSNQLIQKSKELDATPFVAKNKFSDFELSEILLENIIHKGYTSPMPIQDEAIKPILEGRDLIGIANTGTGKTAAFLIPLIQKINKNRMQKVLIITPTRELAVQIHDELKAFSRGLSMHSVLCIGGANMFRQRNELKRNPNFVVGTPGRIKDLVQRKGIHLSEFENVVLDEADRMVDIGFINDVKYFISLLPKERQSLFFSATISGKVKEILQAFVKDPVTVSVKQQETAENIDQDVIKVPNRHQKVDILHNLLAGEEFEKVLVFGRTKWGIQKLTDELIRRGLKAAAIHGNKNQNQRQKALDQFKSNEIRILLATDVASRGLDIPNVSHVINYDLPASYEDYVHRIGRTGRANKKGIALTFVE